MIDQQLSKIKGKTKLKVSTDGTGGPYILVGAIQVKEVTDLLRANQIPHTVDDNAASGGNESISSINLGHADPAKVQELLDSVA